MPKKAVPIGGSLAQPLLKVGLVQKEIRRK
jgi:hypothetical protein